MDHQTEQIHFHSYAADEPRKVETNNIHQILEFFDDEGKLKNQPDTYYVVFAIPCGICQDRNLALTNHYKTQRTRATHEAYAVLPCGHAFGYRCVHKWLYGNRSCPTCRRNPFGPEGFTMLDLFGDADSRDQHEEIKELKALLQRPPPWERRTQPRTQPETQPPQPPPFPRLRRGAVSVGLIDRGGLAPPVLRREPSDRPFDGVSSFRNP
ncbi:hypothetical protein SLS62_002401 [Diatrype stigma]|uniref:RING-type domain-containing protein n=1 Tax=Diatrype stigma TaxID=117547 RepID=A0AAN9UY65_9PEZI